jgi:hypothetical protein
LVVFGLWDLDIYIAIKSSTSYLIRKLFTSRIVVLFSDMKLFQDLFLLFQARSHQLAVVEYKEQLREIVGKQELRKGLIILC